MLTIAPPRPSALASAMNVRQPFRTPPRLTASVRCHSSAVVDGASFGMAMPALLWRTSTGPSAAVAAANAASTCSAEATSHATCRARPPASRIARAVAAAAASSMSQAPSRGAGLGEEARRGAAERAAGTRDERDASREAAAHARCPDGHAAVDDERRARHEARVARGEEDDDLRDLARLADAPEGVQRARVPRARRERVWLRVEEDTCTRRASRRSPGRCGWHEDALPRIIAIARISAITAPFVAQ